MKVAVLGGGRVGGAIARDLASAGEFQVFVADCAEDVLSPLQGIAGISTGCIDLADPEGVARAAEGCEIVVGAVPGFLGYSVVRAALAAGKHVVDISFFPEDPFELDELARRQKVCCLVDLGIAPGCSTLFFGQLQSTWQHIESYACYVGGLPVERTWPWDYKAPFSPSDVIELYTRPARHVAGGQIVTKPALSEPELLEFPGVGTLEAFLTDGLRTLLRVQGVGQMVEKTLRYPGHRERILALRETGFLDATPVQVNGDRISPRALAEALLFKAWRLGPGAEDLTAMRVVATGIDAAGRPARRTWDLLDRYDRATGTTSMARTTGYTCTAGVRLLARGLWRDVGVAPPEWIGQRRECYAFVLAELDRRGVGFVESAG